MIWSELKHFQASGSTPTTQLLCSFTEAIIVANPFVTNASGAIWWPNLVQVTESIPGSIVPLAMFLDNLPTFQIHYFPHLE